MYAERIGTKRGFGNPARGTRSSSSRRSLGHGWSKKVASASVEGDAGATQIDAASGGGAGSGPHPARPITTDETMSAEEKLRRTRMTEKYARWEPTAIGRGRLLFGSTGHEIFKDARPGCLHFATRAPRSTRTR